MADLDAELLALAGDASSDEEDAPMNISGASSMSPDGRNRDGSAKPGKNSSGRRRRSDQNDSEEEGEASSGPGSPDSLQSAPMDESDSDSDASPANIFDGEGDRYPLEGKFINAADRDEIMAMPEIKREELLAERAAEVERDRQNVVLRNMLRKRDTGSKKQDKKRKAGDADLDDSQRKTSRQRTKVGGGKFGESSSGIDNLKRARAEKDDRQRRRKEDNERMRERRNLGLEDYSDPDADGESELEWDEANKQRVRSPSADFQNAQPATFQDIQRIRISRSIFATVCFYPGFEEAITGCYVRISIGKDQESGQNIYRMAVIKGIVEGKPYAVDNPNGRPFVTNQYVRAAHGKAERNWPFIMCSDAIFTETEWSRFQRVCQGEGVPIPTKPKLLSKIEDMNTLVHRRLTDAEIQVKLTKSGALNSKQMPLHRIRINNDIKEAQHAGDDQRVEELRAELEKLEGPKLAFNTSMTSIPKKGAADTGMNHKAQQERIALLNMENRRKNIEEVRQAQINERRAAKRTEAALARGEVVAEDHSKRLKTRAKFKHDVSDTAPKKTEGEQSGTEGPTAGTPTKNAAKSVTSLTTQKYKNGSVAKGLPGLRRPLQDDDIIGSIDLGIELEL